MLQLNNITKDYISGDTVVNALKGISISFREHEFVSILGQSGCGKTTMLNIIGGLDRYTDGDLIIGGRSTKEFKDKDWDSYRNHKIGFIFQSYNLIPHQTVLSNVELALTLSGVSKTDRRKRAVEALEMVGLGDQINKKPNQMSGGQMQRVAIARALVNDPDIILADEPTGALDSETSVQVMDILKKISDNKLIIMVTHNAELAEQYSSRIIRLLDGKVTDDTAPYEIPAGKEISPVAGALDKKEKVSMSFFTALSLSFKNLLTKKGRTFLTSFAGSIGIIGIALILSLSSGFQAYINRVQEDTVSTYPITIENESVDYSSMLNSMMGETGTVEDKEEGRIYAAPVMSQLVNTMSAEVKKNNLSELKKYLESPDCNIGDYVLDVQYQYDIPLNVYAEDYSGGINKVNPSTLYQDIWGVSDETMSSSLVSSFSNTDMWSQMIDNQDLLNSQYDLVAGSWPDNYNEVVVVADKNHQITDVSLYALGIRNSSELKNIMINLNKQLDDKVSSYSYEDLLNLRFKVVLPSAYYRYDEATGAYKNMSSSEDYVKQLIDNGIEVKVSGIIVAKDDAVATSITGVVGYTKNLVDYIVSENNKSDIVKAQLDNPDIDVLTGLPFSTVDIDLTMDDINAYISTLPKEQQKIISAYIANLSDDVIIEMFKSQIQQSSSNTYKNNIEALGYVTTDNPSKINIYAKDFESKDAISDIISAYNDKVKSEGNDSLEISYTDYIGLMMSSVSKVIDAISYVLIAFVSISLVVSSIMIGIITYISVLERTKEIGILRSIGASKHDISRVFNAETMIVGLVAGIIGIGFTLLLNIPINIIIKKFSGISGVAVLPLKGALILIAISVFLTLIAGLIPARVASKKDPVIALRTE
ncbi:MAG: ABC transporter ATP-binding protein/permease [Butyrivibrio crossotus]|nr:ABC transporter ATP-binding protein/permease [Butyrivibrio crossotus]